MTSKQTWDCKVNIHHHAKYLKSKEVGVGTFTTALSPVIEFHTGILESFFPLNLNIGWYPRGLPELYLTHKCFSPF